MSVLGRLELLDVVGLGEGAQAKAERRVVAAVLKLVPEVGKRQERLSRTASTLLRLDRRTQGSTAGREGGGGGG